MSNKNMKVLVTGGAGYIGSHAAKGLSKAGFEPVVVDNLSRGHREAVRWGPFVQADVGDQAALRQVLREYSIDAVMHFAAFAYVGESMQAPGRYFQNNVVSTLNLLEAMREEQVRKIVFSSTCATYGHPQQIPISEDHVQRPANPYGESKLMVERLLHWYSSIHGFAAVALRYFNAAGADPEGKLGECHDPETHLIPVALSAALGSRGALDIYGTDYDTPDGTAIRDYLHVSDLADAHVAALRYLNAGGPSDAFNLGTGVGYSVREVVAMVEQVAHRKVPVRECPRRSGDPASLVAEASKAAQVLSWRPQCSSLEQIVRTAWEWSLNHEKPAAVSSGNQG
jgi:UDP-glucose-4-epimerase GalE